MTDSSQQPPQERPSGMPTLAQPVHHTHMGPVLGVLIVILGCVLVGLYLWGASLNEQQKTTEPPIVNNEPETPRAQTDAQIMETVSPSDDIGAIEADLDGTMLDAANSDLDVMSAEMNQALGS